MSITKQTIAGIIAEYNPFHAGHAYHIEETRRLTGANYIIVIMSGDYVQRGTPAITDKYIRAEAAVRAGADMVIELPVRFSVSSAELFAFGGVSILDKLGFVDYISFGAETDKLDNLNIIADILVNEPEKYKDALRAGLKKGLTFPKAREFAIKEVLENDMSTLLTSPNNILAVEYLKSLKKINSKIAPVFVKRTGDYNLDELTPESYSSATALRKHLYKREDNSVLRNDLSDFMYSHVMQPSFYPISEDNFSDILMYKLNGITKKELCEYLDIDEDLADRLLAFSHNTFTFRELAEALDTKNYTRTRINRSLLHIILDITKVYNFNSYMYVKPLAMKKEATFLLRNLQDAGKVPIISKTADQIRTVSAGMKKALNLDIKATETYNQALYFASGKKLRSDYYRSPIII
ncbi:MAG: nucleotidyltransferase family protein [Lachnospiraceae bacterium]|nr:nucleotidyltransferase family protein [Lachnospiraceae bacterium]